MGQSWRGDTRPVRVVKELVNMSVVLPNPAPALTRLDVRQYALYTSSLQWLCEIGKIFLRFRTYLNVFQNKERIM